MCWLRKQLHVLVALRTAALDTAVVNADHLCLKLFQRFPCGANVLQSQVIGLLLVLSCWDHEPGAIDGVFVNHEQVVPTEKGYDVFVRGVEERIGG